MAGCDQISTKRRRFSPSSTHSMAARILSPNRSPVYVHLNRLGQIRSDACRCRSSRFVHLHRYKESPQNSHPIRDSIPCAPIKDLRARRVFSPASICDEWDSHGGKEQEGIFGEDVIKEPEKGSCSDVNLNGKVSGSSFDADDIISSCLSDLMNESEENGRVEKLGQQSFGYEVNINCVSSLSKNDFVSGCFAGEVLCKNGNKDELDGLEACENGVTKLDLSLSEKGLEDEKNEKVNGLKVFENTTAGDLDEEFQQTTPPDVEILGGERVVAGGIDRNVVDFGSQKINWSPESGTNLKTKSAAKWCSRVKLFKSPGSFSYRRLLPYLMNVTQDNSCATLVGQCSKADKPCDQDHTNRTEENGKTDDALQNVDNIADLKDRKEDVNKSQTEKELGDEIKHALQCADRALSKSSTEHFHRNNISPSNKRNESSPKRKLVQDPFSRRKLFRTPGSVNYRRLLPFFKDILEDNSCTSENSPIPDLDKRVEENILSPLSVSGGEGTSRGNSDHGNDAVVCFSNDCPPPEMVTSKIVKYTCSNDDPEPQPLDHVSESLAPVESEEPETEVKHVILGKENNLEISHEVLVYKNKGSDSQLSPLDSSEPSTESATSASDHLSFDTNGKCINSDVETANNEEQAGANSMPLKTLQLEASVALGTPLCSSPPKGILKTKARGCRGLCTCLNCTSFRLHAERAFEFSRNQMQDAEEMVLDLVGELSYLREMLEKSALVNHAVLFASQAKEACRKASEAAELSKSRLQQMNDDLQVHCRIPSDRRARVKFAHHVHEKIIPRADEPNK